MRIWKHVVLLLSLMVGGYSAFADDSVNININISGTVVANGACTFNNGDSATVDFSEVDFEPADGGTVLSGSYLETVPATMSCTGDAGGKAQMTFSPVGGVTLDYNGHKLLPVSINDSNPGQELGIRLLVNGLVQDVNAPFAVDMLTQQPAIQAELVLVGQGDGLINGARISASATLIMEFV
ncbi:hypothetical protein QNN88_20185 [Citrobacter sp. ANG330]|uniref:Fimbrial protein n=1 Tax=Citrobacter amalonaticus TaxID=35703 RepID=A0A9C7V3J1_CITAM|nr:fimbrial protein [Citrobacter amalonaticus]HCD1255785.1 hypothetical protein [Citrobacter amalonaticus]